MPTDIIMLPPSNLACGETVLDSYLHLQQLLRLTQVSGHRTNYFAAPNWTLLYGGSCLEKID